MCIRDRLSTLENLFKLARERKEKPVDGSYTNKLLADKSLSKSKVLEEINELIEAVDKDTNKIHEAADVFYHLIIYLEAHNIKIEDIESELEKNGLEKLYKKLNIIDVDASERINPNDKQRIMRALEVYEGTKKKISDFWLMDRKKIINQFSICLLYTSPSPRDRTRSRMPSSA